jgi:predicted alpha/beta superfamily hydrolase
MAVSIEPKPYKPLRRDQFEVRADGLGAYTIDVSIPPNVPAGSRLPVILAVDGNLIFDFVHAVAHGGFSEMAPAVPPSVVVGVGYPAAEGFASFYARRNFDFHGDWDMRDRVGAFLQELFTSAKQSEGKPHLEMKAGGYDRFLAFLRDELLPQLAEHYPIDLDARHTLIGDSSGGHFALRAVFDPKSPFSRYVIISPSVGAAAGEIEAAEAAYAKTHTDLLADVFICAGDAEVDDPMYALAKIGTAPIWAAERFALRQWPSARLSWEIMNRENHTSIAARSIAAGLRAVHRVRPGVDSAASAPAEAFRKFVANLDQGD